MINISIQNNNRRKVFVAMAGGVDSSVVAGLVVVFLVIAANRAIAQEVKFSKEWLNCQENKDCVVVSGLCDWECINETDRGTHDWTRIN